MWLLFGSFRTTYHWESVEGAVLLNNALVMIYVFIIIKCLWKRTCYAVLSNIYHLVRMAFQMCSAHTDWMSDSQTEPSPLI